MKNKINMFIKYRKRKKHHQKRHHYLIENKTFLQKITKKIYILNPIRILIIFLVIIIFKLLYLPKKQLKLKEIVKINSPNIPNYLDRIDNSPQLFSSIKPKKTVYCVDYFKRSQNNFFLDMVREKFEIIYTKNNPDYLLYCVFGKGHHNETFNNSIKIFYTTQNSQPDFNECDYALGPGYINYGDRYLRFTFYMLYTTYRNLKEERPYVPGKKFCAWVCTNGWPKVRKQFFEKLSKYKHVDSGGKFKNNIGGPVKDKIGFYRGYKFSIQFENSATLGYTTEKIIDGFDGYTIPIYYGDETIFDIINPKSFIYVKGIDDFDRAIETIKEIDNNEDLYKAMLKEPIYLDKDYPNRQYEKIKKYMQYIFSQDKEKARRVYRMNPK